MSSLAQIYSIPLEIDMRLTIRISAVIVPDAIDGRWDDELRDWPTAVSASKTTFGLDVFDEDGDLMEQETLHEGARFKRVVGEYNPSSSHWQRLFNESRIAFDQQQFDAQRLDPDHTYASFDADELAKYQMALYAGAAVDLSQAISGDEVMRGKGLSTMSSWESRAAGTRTDFETFFRSSANAPIGDLPRFVGRVPYSAALHACMQYPDFARRMGLIIDFDYTPANPLPPTGQLRIRPMTGNLSPNRYTSFLVAYEVGTLTPRGNNAARSVVMPGSRENNQFGFTRIGGPDGTSPFFIHSFDVDGTAFKTKNASRLSNRVATTGVRSTEPGPPAMRSYGFGFYERDAALRLKESAKRSEEIEKSSLDARGNPIALPKELLYAEDLTVGTRFDVHTQNRRYSLYEKSVALVDPLVTTFHFYPNHGRKVEESYTERASTLTDSGNGDIVENVHAMVAQWDGWSLSLQRPGKHPVAAPIPEEEPFDESIALLPNSLPKLRYGQSYSFSARSVFLGGLGLEMAQAEALAALVDRSAYEFEDEIFTRAEVVRSPVVGFDENDGESIDSRTVIIGKEGELPRRERRWFYPPEAELPICEFSGAIEDYSRTPEDQYELLAGRIPGTIPLEVRGDTNEYLPDPWAEAAQVSIQITSRHHPHFAPANQTDSKRQVLTEQPNGVWSRTIPFYKNNARWPFADPFSIDIETASDGPSYVRVIRKEARAGERIRIRIAPGDHIRIKVSSCVDKNRFPRFSLYHWLGSPSLFLDDRDLIQLASRVRQELGCHPVTTPATELVLQHAVKQPVMAAAFTDPAVNRSPGAYAFELIDQLAVDGASTGELAVEANWADKIDDISRKGPTEVERQGSSAFATVNTNASSYSARGSDLRIELPDTRARTLFVSTVARGRWDHIFDEGDTTTVQSGERMLLIPNSGVPKQPSIKHVVPIFNWERTRVSRRKLRSERRGNRIRLFLNRGWFDTGDGEQLGVVCWPDAMRDLPRANRESLRPFVTQWGKEPLLHTPNLPAGPFAHHFLNATTYRAGIQLQEFVNPQPGEVDTASEFRDRRVSIAGYTPAYDELREVWLVDIGLDCPDSYLPWVKLSLVRFQPNSIEGHEISRVAQVVFAQLQPDRVATVNVNSVDQKLIEVIVAGPAGKGTPNALSTPNLTIRLQKRCYSGSDVLWESVGVDKRLQRDSRLQRGGAWHGALRLPDGSLDDYRLEVRETLSAAQDAVDVYGKRRDRPAVRTIYVEHIGLDSLYLNRGATRAVVRSGAV